MARNLMETLRRMKALAEDERNNQNQRDIALAKMLKWAARYNIDPSIIDNENPQNAATDKTIRFHAPFVKAKARLYNTIIHAYQCRGVCTNRKANVFHYFGYEYDLNLADKVFDILWENGLEELAMAEMPSWESRKSFSTSFWDGYTEVIRRRLQIALSKAIEESTTPGTELMLADKARQAEALRDKKYPQLRHSVRYTSVNSGYYAGRVAGERANLGAAQID